MKTPTNSEEWHSWWLSKLYARLFGIPEEKPTPTVRYVIRHKSGATTTKWTDGRTVETPAVIGPGVSA